MKNGDSKYVILLKYFSLFISLIILILTSSILYLAVTGSKGFGTSTMASSEFYTRVISVDEYKEVIKGMGLDSYTNNEGITSGMVSRVVFTIDVNSPISSLEELSGSELPVTAMYYSDDGTLLYEELFSSLEEAKSSSLHEGDIVSSKGISSFERKSLADTVDVYVTYYSLSVSEALGTVLLPTHLSFSLVRN